MVSLLFLLASLGAINGTLLGAYLLVSRWRVVHDRYFAGLLLALGLRIGKSVGAHFFESVDRLILQLGLSAGLFIGPFFWLYLRARAYPHKNTQRQDAALLLFLALAITVVGVMYPYRSHPDVWNGYVVYGIYIVWALFVILGLFPGIRWLRQTWLKPTRATEDLPYLAGIITSVVFITFTFQLALYTRIGYIWGSIIFSLTFYYLTFRALRPRLSIAPKSNTAPSPADQQLLLDLNQLMEGEKLYLQQGLKLDTLADHAGQGRHTVSRVLNETYGHGFTHYVNQYRIAEAQNLILSRPELSLEGIGYEAGFRSKSVFFEAFKKQTGTTPAQFRKEQNAPK